MSEREITLRFFTTGDDDWETVVYKETELLAQRAELLAGMGITYEEYVQTRRDSRCSCCSRPDWSDRWAKWDSVQRLDDYLGIDTTYGRNPN